MGHNEGAGLLVPSHAHLHGHLCEDHSHSQLRARPRTRPQRGRGHQSLQADWKVGHQRNQSSSGRHSHQDCGVLHSLLGMGLHTHGHTHTHK